MEGYGEESYLKDKMLLNPRNQRIRSGWVATCEKITTNRCSQHNVLEELKLRSEYKIEQKFERRILLAKESFKKHSGVVP